MFIIMANTVRDIPSQQNRLNLASDILHSQLYHGHRDLWFVTHKCVCVLGTLLWTCHANCLLEVKSRRSLCATAPDNLFSYKFRICFWMTGLQQYRQHCMQSLLWCGLHLSSAHFRGGLHMVCAPWVPHVGQHKANVSLCSRSFSFWSCLK